MKPFKYIAISNKGEAHIFSATSYREAKHWVINNLDCSQEWQVNTAGYYYNCVKEFGV